MRSYLRAIEITRDTGPLIPQVIYLTSDINIIYGLNGVGKSIFLKNLTESFTIKSNDNASVSGFSFDLFLKFEDGEPKKSIKSNRRNDWDLDEPPIYDFAPFTMSEALEQYSFGFVGFPLKKRDDEYLFDDRFNFDGLEVKESEKVLKAWLGGQALLRFSKSRRELYKNYFEVSVCLDKHFLSQFQQEMLSNITNLFDRFDAEAQSNFEGYNDQNEFMIENAWTALYDLHSATNLFLNGKNFSHSTIIGEEHIYFRDTQFVDLPILGYSESLGMAVISEDTTVLSSDTVSEFDELNYSTIESILKRNPPKLNWKLNKKSAFEKIAIQLENLKEGVANLNSRVNDIFATLLLNAPTIEFLPTLNQENLNGPIYSWYFKLDKSYLGYLGIENLSTAQLRWAKIAIELALMGDPGNYLRVPILIIDEPEAALHISAQRHLARGIEKLSESLGIQVIIATHSPLFINTKKSNIFEIRSTEEGSKIIKFPEDVRENLSNLGLEPVDLLRGIKHFLVVEGQHEVEVLNYLFKSEFDDRNVKILPLRGAKHLSSILNSSFIFEFTAAKIHVMLDNLDAARVEEVWRYATDLNDLNNIDETKKYILDNLPANERIEFKFLREFIVKSIENSVTDRISIISMSKQDIIEYLPSESFVKGKTWEELKDKWHNSNSKNDFKSWLSKSYGISFDTQTLISAMEKMDSLHIDLTNTLSELH